MKKIVIIILLLATVGYANDWCYDFPRGLQPDTDGLHICGSYALTDLAVQAGFNEATACLTVMTLGVAWEFGQAILWQSGDHYNGDRVDATDVGFNLGGILLHAITHPGKKEEKRIIDKKLFAWKD